MTQHQPVQLIYPGNKGAYSEVSIQCSYEGDVAELGLTFSVDDDTLGKVVTVPLRENGTEIPVTNEDKLLYVHLLTDWHLIKRLNKASAAFARGLNRVSF